MELLNIPKQDLDYIICSIGGSWDRLRGQKIFLTGGTGFIGKWILGSFLYANRVLELGATVKVLSRTPSLFLQEYPSLRNRSDLILLGGDVRNVSSDMVKDCTYIFHAATDVASISSSYEVFDTCVLGTRSLLQAIGRDSTERHMVLLSSGAVYGKIPTALGRVSEDWLGGPDPLIAASAYGEGKRASEMLCTLSSLEQPQLHISIARCFAFVGPHLPFDKQFAIGNFIGAVMNGVDIFIKGDGTPLRSYLYAADLTRWLWTLLFDAPTGSAYNIGGAECLSIYDLAHKVNQILGGSSRIEIGQIPNRNDKPSAYIPSIKKIAADLGLKPTISLDDSILRTANWAASQNRSKVI